jgi:hypothetical protein
LFLDVVWQVPMFPLLLPTLPFICLLSVCLLFTVESFHIAIWFLKFVFSHHVYCFSVLVLLLCSYFPDCLVDLPLLVGSLRMSFRLISPTHTSCKSAVLSALLHISSCFDFGCVAHSLTVFSTYCDVFSIASCACI